MASVDLIRIDGLREFNRALKAVDDKLPSATRLAANSAAQLVVDTAKPRVPLGPGKGGHAVSSVKARSTRTAARVAEGGKRFPYMPWLDFGGAVGPRKRTKRPFRREGRYVWAAYAERREDVQQRLQEALIEVARGAGLDVTP